MTTCTCEHVAVLTVEGRTRFLPAADAESARSLAQRMMLAALAQTNWAEQSFQETFRPKALEYAAESCIDSEVAEIAQLVEDAGALEAEQIQFSAATRHPDPLVDPSPYPLAVDDRPWELLNGGPVRAGDEVRRDYLGMTTTAVLGRVDGYGALRTAEGGFIGMLDLGTWYVRRPVQELPTEDGAQIIPARGLIEAVRDGVTYTAVRATYDGLEGVWVGVWRGEGNRVTYVMPAGNITTDTCKVEEK